MGAEIGGQGGERDGTELGDNQRFGGMQRFGQLPLHGLLDEAGGIVVAKPEADKARCAERGVDIGERDGLERPRHLPAAAMALGGAHEPSLPEARHGATHNDGISAHTLRQLLRCHRARLMRHVQQGMENGGEAMIGFHVTIYVT